MIFWRIRRPYWQPCRHPEDWSEGFGDGPCQAPSRVIVVRIEVPVTCLNQNMIES